jgi:hypothetical protein
MSEVRTVNCMQAFGSAAGVARAALSCMYAYTAVAEWEMLREMAGHVQELLAGSLQGEELGQEGLEVAHQLSDQLAHVIQVS